LRAPARRPRFFCWSRWSRPLHARQFAIFASLLAGCAAACTGTEPFVPEPTTITLNSSTVSFGAIGQTQQITATVLDQHGTAMSNQAVSWTTSDASIVTAVTSTGSTATVTARGNGSAHVTAQAGKASAQLSVTVAQLLGGMVKTSGDGQVDTVGRTLALPLVTTVGDALGNPMPNIPVLFQVTSGGGQLSAIADTSGADGRVTVTWTLGTIPGTQAVMVSDPTAHAGPVFFHASAQAGHVVTFTRITVDSQRAAVGKPVPIAPAVQLADTFNNPVPNAVVSFVPTLGGGSVPSATVTTAANGIAASRWVVGSSPGENDLGVTAPGGFSTTFFAIASNPGPPAIVAVTTGDNQTGLTGYALNIAPQVKVEDSVGILLDSVSVNFTPSAGGSVSGGATITDSNGVATVGSWTVVTGANTLTASVPSASVAPAVIHATGATQQFNIDLRYLTAVAPLQQQAFENARARWETLIYGDEPDVALNVPAGSCGAGTPAINETVDDIVIFVVIDSIDGPGGILGQAGACIVRSPGFLPLVGIMHFDVADVNSLIASGQFDTVILHEMAHVLGFSAGIWSQLNLIVGRGGPDPHFVGTTATAAFDRSGGLHYTAGQKVPLENCAGCGPGTIDSHWRESVFDNELMTGFINSNTSNPLSVITTAAMGDMGHQVNFAASDAYTVPHAAAMLAPGPAPLELRDDILPLPLILVNRWGGVVGVVAPRR
jgi:leishmanolysin